MGMPLMFDTHDVLDAFHGDADSRDRGTEFVRAVGTWFAKMFCSASAEDKAEVMLGVRPHLRAGGFDICDSDTSREVGCDFCIKMNRYGFGDLVDTWDERVKARVVNATSEPFMEFRANLSESYVFGFAMPINYCPMCGRRVFPDKTVE